MNGLSYEQLLAYIQGLYDEGGLSEEDYNRIILYILANGNLETSPRDLIQIRRGLEENLPNLAQGEMGYTIDTDQLFIGGLNGNVPLNNRINNNIVITVGYGGDYATINDALGFISRKQPIYIKKGLSVELKLLEGFVLREQVLISNNDLSFVEITGEDSVTTIDREYITETFGGYGLDYKPVFGVVKGGSLPVIKQLFEMNESGSVDNQVGIFIGGVGSYAEVSENCGVNKSALDGVFITHGGMFVGKNTQFKNSGRRGLFCSWGSNAIVDFIDVSFSGEDGIYSSRGSNVECTGVVAEDCGGFAIHARYNSKINAYRGKANRAGTRGVFAIQTSTIEFTEGQANDCGDFGINANQGSTINTMNSEVKNVNGFAIFSYRGSIINARGSDVSGSQHGLRAYRGSIINGNDVIANNCVQNGVWCSDGSTISCEGVEAKNCGLYGLFAEEGGKITAGESNNKKADVSGSGSHGVYANKLGVINAHGIKVNNSGNTGVQARSGSIINIENGEILDPTAQGIYVRSGSTVNAENVTIENCLNIGVHLIEGSTCNFNNGKAINSSNNSARIVGGSKLTAVNSNLRKVVGTDSSNDLSVETGSIVSFNGGLGGHTLTPNEITSDGFIIK